MNPALEVLGAFLKLGCTSFGGPIAHIGYFRQEFVVKRRWIDELAFSDLLSVCQFLPGPASSQLGVSIGLARAGYGGGLAAWVGFTLPSALVLVGLGVGLGSDAWAGSLQRGLLHGLKLVAVAVVAQAVWGMARSLCPDRLRACLAAAAAAVLLVSGTSSAQVAVLLAGGIFGYWLCRSSIDAPATGMAVAVSRRAGKAALIGFAVLLLGLPLCRGFGSWQQMALLDAFYRTGALVFGGGHVVLPLLQDAMVRPGRVTEDAFLAGYGAAQAIPGPLFTFAGYLGALAAPAAHRWAGALLGLLGIFLPGMLILVGVLPFWAGLRARSDAQAVMRGINATVVGLLAAALYDPIWTSTVKSASDVGIAVTGFALLSLGRAPPLLVVVLGAVSGMLLPP